MKLWGRIAHPVSVWKSLAAFCEMSLLSRFCSMRPTEPFLTEEPTVPEKSYPPTSPSRCPPPGLRVFGSCSHGMGRGGGQLARKHRLTSWM